MVFRGRADDPYLGKSLFLDVHYVVSSWRVLVFDWIRQLLRGHAPFDVARRLHYEVVERRLGLGFGLVARRFRWLWKTPELVSWKRIGLDVAVT